MGFHLTWVATRGLGRERVLELSQLHPTGERESLPEADITATELTSGWFVIVLNRAYDERLEAITGSLVGSSEVVVCVVEEGGMVSLAQAWQHGAPRWRVTHELDRGHQHLEVEGDPPPMLTSIVAATRARDDGGADYFFDIPVDLAQSLTGFRHDQDPDSKVPSDEPFEILAASRSSGSR